MTSTRPLRHVPDELLSFIEAYETYYILGHVEPDGDCIGSQLSLSLFLRRIGKKTQLVSPGPFERSEVRHFADRFLTSIPPASDDGERSPEAVIIVDCSTLDRIGNLAEELRGLPVAVIDHHSSGEIFGDVRFVDSTVAATTLLVQALIEARGETIATNEAELLFFGLATDSGFFRFLDRSSEDVFAAASRLVAAGASPREVSGMIVGGRSFASRKLIGNLLSRAQSYFHGRFVLTYMTADERREYGKENRDSDALYGLLLSIDECEAIAFIREESSDVCKGSLRASGPVDVGKVASTLGGGGHQKAAGFLQRRSLTDTIKEVVARVGVELGEESGTALPR